MKKIIYFICTCLAILTIQAQDLDEPSQAPSAKEKIKAARVGLITQRLNLTSEQAQKFWPIYNEFDLKRTEIRKPYREAQRKIRNISDPIQQQAVVDLGLKVKQDELNLEKEYSAKLSNVITAQQMLSLHQAEHDFRNIIINMLNNRRLQRNGKFRDKSAKPID
ncbi:MAG: hypothetical protein JST48_14705 [Bacteroidetes bacterium]|nr:hypothetical protein [Bacteroidota bacterium]